MAYLFYTLGHDKCLLVFEFAIFHTNHAVGFVGINGNMPFFRKGFRVIGEIGSEGF